MLRETDHRHTRRAHIGLSVALRLVFRDGLAKDLHCLPLGFSVLRLMHMPGVGAQVFLPAAQLWGKRKSESSRT